MPRHPFVSLSFVRARPTVAALALAVLLSGCQSGSTPVNSASQTGTTTATPTSSVAAPGTPSEIPTPATGTTPAVYKPADATGKAENVPAPVMPELAKENSKAGLEAFIGYWFQLLSYAYETGETAKSKELSSESCILCMDLVSGVATNYTEGRWLVGGQYQTPVIEVLWEPSAKAQTAKVQVLQQQILYLNADGSNGREPAPAINDAAAFFAEYSNGAWSTTDLGVIR
ncbi:DUF6318 family protein [Paenarthrobacter aurescens]|nr:DUF6318 family protein [Paenarthrobacter aurescens]MDO6145302.1 DUF6318 family protein [Paenarthrobacter aurescens]MDO6145929.1 DUF6318 family protein [Paenarthrobacter aurescens]MDO6157173.1 DUF6318 family protein [Paenarthrobacter aurescens]MDO6161158.1 DUF6318 family protein [Paenarthrobacter aurescens]